METNSPGEEAPFPADDSDALEARGLPPVVRASPNEIDASPGESIRWWRPSWRDSLGQLGWRWVFFFPIVASVALMVWFCAYRSVFDAFLMLGAKLAVFIGVAVISLFAFGVRSAVRLRREPFCIFCGYNLSNLPDHYRCPECGRAYSWALIAEYRRDPHWFVERFEAQKLLPPSQRAFGAGNTPRRRRAKDGTE